MMLTMYVPAYDSPVRSKGRVAKLGNILTRFRRKFTCNENVFVSRLVLVNLCRSITHKVLSHLIFIKN